MEKKPYSDSRWTEPMIGEDVACNGCLHYRGFAKCDAFPEGIPTELGTTKVTHTKPYQGDGGIRYEKNPNYHFVSPSSFLKK